MKGIFLTLSIGEESNRRCLKLLDSILEKSWFPIIITTDDPKFFAAYDRQVLLSRLILDKFHGDRYDYMLNGEFNYNVKRYPFKRLLTRSANEDYIIWLDSDSYLSDLYSDEKLMELLSNDDCDFLARRSLMIQDGLAGGNKFDKQILDKYNFYNHEFPFITTESIIPIENIMFFKYDYNKVLEFYDTWDRLSHELNKNNTIQAWLEGIEIGISLKHSGFKCCGITQNMEISNLFSFEHWNGRIFKTIFD